MVYIIRTTWTFTERDRNILLLFLKAILPMKIFEYIFIGHIMVDILALIMRDLTYI